MATTTQPEFQMPGDWSLADLHQRLGGIPLERIRLNPPAGMATEEDVLRIHDHEDRLFELIDGTLVEKAMGWYESLLAGLILTELNNFLRRNKLGKAFGADAAMRILSSQVRIPDVGFISWDRFPKGPLPRRPITRLVPDLAVEVLSETNTPAEMDRKLQDYFAAGVRLVWYIDPATRSATVYTDASQGEHIPEDGLLDGGPVLPGFSLSLRGLFAEADEQGA
jgi:Uma2 family endonuclease